MFLYRFTPQDLRLGMNVPGVPGATSNAQPACVYQEHSHTGLSLGDPCGKDAKSQLIAGGVPCGVFCEEHVFEAFPVDEETGLVIDAKFVPITD